MDKQSRGTRSGFSPAGGGTAEEALRALTAAVLELQAAMQELKATMAPSGAGGADGGQFNLPLTPQEQFDLETLTQYDLPSAHLKGAIDRAKAMPFSPSSIYGLEAQRIALDRREGQRLSEHERQQADSGLLSPEDALGIAEEQERLLTDEARATGDMAHGMEDQLPALSANRPEAFLRTDSVQLAAMRHLRTMPLSDDGMLASAEQAAGSSSFGYSEAARLAEAIGRLADAISHGGALSGSPLHPGEAAGSLNGILQAVRVPLRPDSYN